MNYTRVNSSEELDVYEEVGRGGFGVVYRGIIKSTNQEVAIKQIDLEKDLTDLIEINKEIQIISECHCQQITSYMGSFVKNYKLWVIMEFIDGGSIFELLKPGPIDDEKIVSFILYEILLALNYLHNQGKIHRDLKSQNILISKTGDIKLTDFGVSTQLSSNFSKRNTTVGTPYWMAPEVIVNNNGGHSYKADIWSLGCCCYEMFTGKPPLQSKYPPMRALRLISKCQKNQDFIKLIELNELDISWEFKDFLHQCFIEDPKLRASASKLLKHKFITKHIHDKDKVKLLKKLITKKQLWNQQNHIVKTQNYYVPTEIYNNQLKWNMDDQNGNENQQTELTKESQDQHTGNTIKFDISSLMLNNDLEDDIEEDVEDDAHEERKSSPSSEPNDDIIGFFKNDFNNILTKIFNKIDNRNQLSRLQYDQLVEMNNLMGQLITNDNGGTNNNRKILLFQYLKYLIKELLKEKNSHINRLILPSSILRNTGTNGITTNISGNTLVNNNNHMTNMTNFTTNGILSSTTSTTTVNHNRTTSHTWTKFDEIESSLLESWINRMEQDN